MLRFTVRKRLARHAMHGVRVLRVHVGALHIRNAGRCVRARRAAPPRMRLFVRCEWNPTDVVDRRATTVADERNERGRPRRRRLRARTGRPGPAIAVPVAMPAAVVERRVAPVGIIDPRPTIIRFGNPSSRRVRRPVGGLVRDPFVAVVGIVLPLAIAAERVEAGDRRRCVLISVGVFERRVAVVIPLVERIAVASMNVAERGVVRRSPHEHRAARVKPAHTVRQENCGVSGTHGNRRNAVRIDADTIGARFARPHDDRWRFDLRVLRGRMKYTDADAAGRQLHRVIAAAEFGETNLRIGPDANDVPIIELHFRARIRRGRDVVADHERRVDAGGHDVTRVTALHADVSVQRADECNARIVGLRVNARARPRDQR